MRGGLPRGRLTLIYGEAKSGKTTFAMQCATNCAKNGLKTVYIDSDQAFSPMRLAQICGYDADLASFIIVVKPQDFQEQSHLVSQLLKDVVNPQVALIVIDTINSLYRLEMGNRMFPSKDLNWQLAFLTQLAREERVAILLLSQVRAQLGKNSAEVEPVANRILRFWADIIVRLKPSPRSDVRIAVLEKYGAEEPNTDCRFRLVEEGMKEL